MSRDKKLLICMLSITLVFVITILFYYILLTIYCPELNNRNPKYAIY
jgi:hypothetical protein